MAVLLLAEITDGQLSVDATAKAVTACGPLGDITVLACGARAADAAQEAAKIEGVSKVLVAEDPIYGHRLAEPAAALMVGLAGDYSHIVAPATTTDAKNVMPRVRGAAGRHDPVGRAGGRGRRHVRAADLCRQRHPDRQVGRRQEGRDHPDVDLRRGGHGRLGRGRDHRRRARTRACRAGSRTRRSPRTGPS